MGDTTPLCLHCGIKPGDRRRGLCSTCYYKPEIRSKYQTKFEHDCPHPCKRCKKQIVGRRSIAVYCQECAVVALSEYRQGYRELNRPCAKQYADNYYKENPEKFEEYRKRRRVRGREEEHRKSYTKDPEKFKARSRRAAQKREKEKSEREFRAIVSKLEELANESNRAENT